MIYSTVRYGSSGDDVKKLQQSLKDKGYTLTVDGQFGTETQNAVRDYQSKNGLTADGIVGSDTWGSLTGSAASGYQTTSSGYQNVSPGTNPGSYQSAQQAPEAYQSTRQAPEAYQSPYDEQIRSLYDQIVNRPAFSFDLDGSAVYQQYRDQYARLGKTAMQDTMAQASGLTGGYGSSYAQNAGQQAYNGYLQQLGDIVPDLYAAEREAYDNEGTNLYNRYSLLMDRENTAYNRWADEYSRYLTQEQQDYSRWQDEYSRYLTQEQQDYSRWQDDYNRYLAAGGGSGSSGGGGSSSGSGSASGSGLSGEDAIIAQAASYVSQYPNAGLDSTAYRSYAQKLGLSGGDEALFRSYVQYYLSLYSAQNAPKGTAAGGNLGPQRSDRLN